MAEPARRPRSRRLLANRRGGRVAAAALMCAAIGLPVSFATSPSATAAQLVPPAPRRDSGAPNARSAPAPRWGIRHRRQCVQVELHDDDISGPEGDRRREVLHDVRQGDELDLGARPLLRAKAYSHWVRSTQQPSQPRRSSLVTSRPRVRKRRQTWSLLRRVKRPRQSRSVRSRPTGALGRGRSSAARRRTMRPKPPWLLTRGPSSTGW